MKQEIKTVCVYCGASSRVSDTYRHAIETLARGLVKSGIAIVYGGGSVGTMGYLARAAMAAGGRVIGVIPEHIISVEGQDDVSEVHVVDSMHSRKMLMVEKSDAFISMPGGMGTLDETFEILTWKYLGLHDKPIILGNINGYWDPLMDLLKNMIAEKYTPEQHLDLFRMGNDADEILSYISNYDMTGHSEAKINKM